MDEFRKNAVCLAPIIGLVWRKVVDDVGIGLSKLNKDGNAQRYTDLVTPKDREFCP